MDYIEISGDRCKTSADCPVARSRCAQITNFGINQGRFCMNKKYLKVDIKEVYKIVLRYNLHLLCFISNPYKQPFLQLVDFFGNVKQPTG